MKKVKASIFYKDGKRPLKTINLEVSEELTKEQIDDKARFHLMGCIKFETEISDKIPTDLIYLIKDECNELLKVR